MRFFGLEIRRPTKLIATLAAAAVNPLSYVLCFAMTGAAAIVGGVFVLAGLGWALVAAGAFLIAASAFITKGMSPNG